MKAFNGLENVESKAFRSVRRNTTCCVDWPVKFKWLFKCNQQDGTLHNLFISVKSSTCFRRFLRPSSGAQNCSSISSTAVAGSSKGLKKYLMLYIQLWTPDDGRRNRLKHVENFTEINKLCNVTSSWLYLKILWHYLLNGSTKTAIHYFPHTRLYNRSINFKNTLRLAF